MNALNPSVTPTARALRGGVLALVALLCVGLTALLWPQWQHNPDLSHGLFTPVIFLLLLREVRQHRAGRSIAESPLISGVRGLAVLAGVALVGVGGLFAAAVNWTHTLVGFSLALALAALLTASWLWLASERVRWLPLSWPVAVAVLLWPLSAPIPPGTYSRLSLQLQLWVTDVVVGVLHFMGIPAAKIGNIIELAHAQVGVEEACSGVRSLISCIVAGLFFSATLVRRPWARAVVVGLAVPLALGMNLVRSLGLTLLANAGVDIGGRWHDITGFAILGVTAALLGGIALLLEERGAETPATAATSATSRSPGWLVPAGLFVAVALATTFALLSFKPAPPPGPVPDLVAILPLEPSGWDRVYTEDLYQFSAVLKTEHLIQRSYERILPSGSRAFVTVYLAYWPTGQVPVSLVASHTPDACWPGTGWVQGPRPTLPEPFTVGGAPLTAPAYRIFHNGPSSEYVWYWHLYGGRPIVQIEPRSPRALLEIALRYGFRTAGDQLFVRVSSNLPWEQLRDDPLLTRVFTRLHPLGL
jgi:exosortase